jgi:hypothetical protein
VEGLQALISCSHSIYFVYISDGPLARDLEELSRLEALHSRTPVIAALERAVAFGRF